MSLLTEPDVTPNRIRSIFRWLLTKPKPHFEEEETLLKQYLIPEPFRYAGANKGNDRHETLAKIIRESIELGLFERVDNKIRLTERARLPFTRTPYQDSLFALLLSDLVFGEYERNHDLAYALAWLLHLDPYDVPKDWEAFQQSINATRFDSMTRLSNDARFSGFRAWSNFLGFSWSHSFGKNAVLTPNATDHVTWRLPELLPVGEEVAMTDFMLRLREKVPLLEGGRFREVVEEINPLFRERGTNELSAGTAMVLSFLEANGQVTLLTRSDTAVWVLPGEGSENLRISHIKRLS